MIPKFIKDIIQNLSYNDLLKWSKDIFKFFHNPLNLIKDFDNSNQKFEQILFYALILTIIYTLNFKNFELTNIKSYGFILSLLIYSLPFSIINYISIISFKKVKFWSLFSNILLLSFITSIFSSILIGLFIKNENYNFLLINTIINVVFYLYALFLLIFIYLKKLKHRIISILYSIFLFNALTIISVFMYRNDNNNTILSFDPIYNEHLKSTEHIKTFKGEPHSITKIISKDKKVEYYNQFSTIENDTIFRNSDKMLDYYKDLFKNNSIKLNKISDSLYFDRNKKAIKYLSQYFDNLYTMFNYEYSEDEIINQRIYLDQDSTVIFYEKEYSINKGIIMPYKEYEQISKSINEGNEYANKPSIILSILNIPTSIFLKIFKIEIESDINILI